MKTQKILKIFFMLSALLTGKYAIADLTTGLIAYYPFNGNANDESGNGNNGIVYGATLTNDRFGNANSAYSFNGNNNYIDLGNNSNFNRHSEITIAMWIKMRECSPIITKWKTSEYKGSWYLSAENCYPRFGISGDGISGDYYAESNILLDPNVFYHLVGTYNISDNIIRLYINGTERGNRLGQSGSIFISNSKILVGAFMYFAGDTFFNGELDEMRIYNRALSASEVQQLYQEDTNSESQTTLSASVERMMSQRGSITCTNLTTGNAKMLKVVKGTILWDCEKAGLVVNTGDKVQIKATVNGIAK